MAEQQRLEVIYSLAAQAELDELWEWNLKNHGFEQARAYLEFLQDNLDELGIDRTLTKPVNNRNSLHYLRMQWSPNSYSHIGVFEVNEAAGTLTIAHIFHSSQHWRTRLKKDG